MTCHLCVGFCEGSKLQRQTVAIFDGDDYEIKQALIRSQELPDSMIATELRMFVLVDLGHILIKHKYAELAKHSGIDMLLETPWLQTRAVCSVPALTARTKALADSLETFDALKFESRLRKSRNPSHNTAELFDSGFLLEPLTRAINFYRVLIDKLVSALNGRFRVDSAHAKVNAEHCGRDAVKMLHELGFMPHDYLFVLNCLHKTTEDEVVDLWTSNLPFLDSHSTLTAPYTKVQRVS